MKHRKYAVQPIIGLLCSLALIILFNAQDLAEDTETANRENLFERLHLLSYDERVEAPNFSLPDMHGDTLTLSDLQGQVVFLNFWTTW